MGDSWHHRHRCPNCHPARFAIVTRADGVKAHPDRGVRYCKVFLDGVEVLDARAYHAGVEGWVHFRHVTLEHAPRINGQYVLRHRMHRCPCGGGFTCQDVRYGSVTIEHYWMRAVS